VIKESSNPVAASTLEGARAWIANGFDRGDRRFTWIVERIRFSGISELQTI
jgi:hypothetical protein